VAARVAIAVAGGQQVAVAAISAALTVAATLWSRTLQPHIPARFAEQPWGCLFPLLAASGFAAAVWMRRKKRDLAAFLGSTVFLVGMLTSVAFSLFPYVLPGNPDPSRGLTVHNSAAPVSGLRTALLWWIPGMLPVIGYFVFVHRKFSGKIDASESGY